MVYKEYQAWSKVDAKQGVYLLHLCHCTFDFFIASDDDLLRNLSLVPGIREEADDLVLVFLSVPIKAFQTALSLDMSSQAEVLQEYVDLVVVPLHVISDVVSLENELNERLSGPHSNRVSYTLEQSV